MRFGSYERTTATVTRTEFALFRTETPKRRRRPSPSGKAKSAAESGPAKSVSIKDAKALAKMLNEHPDSERRAEEALKSGRIYGQDVDRAAVDAKGKPAYFKTEDGKEVVRGEKGWEPAPEGTEQSIQARPAADSESKSGSEAPPSAPPSTPTAAS